MTAVQTGPSSIRVTWTTPTPLGDTTGYIISYASDSDSGNVTVVGGFVTMVTLTSLQNGDTYTISIVAISNTSFPSDNLAIMVGLGKLLMLLHECIPIFTNMYVSLVLLQFHFS